jgi:hypothetical protein
MLSVGIEYLHICIESGSLKMWGIVKKGITVEQFLKANRKIAKLNDIASKPNKLC